MLAAGLVFTGLVATLLGTKNGLARHYLGSLCVGQSKLQNQIRPFVQFATTGISAAREKI